MTEHPDAGRIDGIMKARAAALALRPEAPETDGGEYLEFELSGKRFALPFAGLRGVVAAGRWTPIPGAPEPVMGILEHRGTIVPVIDLRPALGLRADAPSRASRMIVLDGDGSPLGVYADRVAGVRTRRRSEVKPAGVAGSGIPGMVCGLADDGTLVLDAASLLALPSVATGHA